MLPLKHDDAWKDQWACWCTDSVKMLHQIRIVYERIPSLHGNGRWIHGPWLYSCRMLKKDSASQVQFQPSPARAPSHLQAAAATSQVALPKTWKALNIACRMPGNTPGLVCSPTSPQKTVKTRENRPQRRTTTQQRHLYLKDKWQVDKPSTIRPSLNTT